MITAAQVKTKPTIRNAFGFAAYQLGRYLRPNNPVRTIAEELKLMLPPINRHGVNVAVAYNDFSDPSTGFKGIKSARVIFDDYITNPYTDGSMYEIGTDAYDDIFVHHYFQDPENNFHKTMTTRSFTTFDAARDYLIQALNYHLHTPLMASKHKSTPQAVIS